MYFFEALKNYGRLKKAFEAAKGPATAYHRLEEKIRSNPESIIVISGKYVLMDKEAYNSLLDAKTAQDMTPRTASDYLLELYRRCAASGFDMTRAEDRAINMALQALSLTEPADMEKLFKTATEDFDDFDSEIDIPLEDTDHLKVEKGELSQAVERAKKESTSEEDTEQTLSFVKG